MDGCTETKRGVEYLMTELLIVIGYKTSDVVLPILPVAEEFKTAFGHSG